MKPALLLLLASPLAHPCDWVSTVKVDPMTDAKVCYIQSPSARLTISAEPGRVLFLSGSEYRRNYLSLRIDDQPELFMSVPENTPRALKQIESGSRLRVRYRTIRGFVDGDAAICNLPDLIRSCR